MMILTIGELYTTREKKNNITSTNVEEEDMSEKVKHPKLGDTKTVDGKKLIYKGIGSMIGWYEVEDS